MSRTRSDRRPAEPPPTREPRAGSCRMCGSENVRPAGVVEGYAFTECLHCRFVFAPAITSERMSRLYEDGYHGPEDGAPAVGWASTEFLEPTLERMMRGAPLDILDFGTGQSRVPEILRARGHRVTAVDVVPPRREHPDRLTGDLVDLALPAGRFDLVYTFQVVEHLPQPRRYLAELLRLTRPGGLVLVHTDMEVPERSGGVERWWYVMPPDHCSFFRHRTFEVFIDGTSHQLAAAEPKSVTLRVGESSGA